MSPRGRARRRGLQRIKSQVRKDRRVLRIGSDQFVWFSSDVPPDDALMPVERIRQILTKTRFPAPEPAVAISVWGGVAIGLEGDDAPGLLTRLHDTLHYAVQQGADASCLDGGQGPRAAGLHSRSRWRSRNACCRQGTGTSGRQSTAAQTTAGRCRPTACGKNAASIRPGRISKCRSVSARPIHSPQNAHQPSPVRRTAETSRIRVSISACPSARRSGCQSDHRRTRPRPVPATIASPNGR